MPSGDSSGTDFSKCSKICPPEQMKNCTDRYEISPEEMIEIIKNALIRLKLASPESFEIGALDVLKSETQEALYLIENGVFNVMQLFPVMELAGVRVDNLPTREQFILRALEGFQEHTNINAEGIIGAVQFGQEWVLLVVGDLDGQGNELVTKYVRTTARCRCNVLDTTLIAQPDKLKQWLTDRNYESYLPLLSTLEQLID